jgi:ABC-type antimicrobial peptide transport system permease subunit
MAAHMSNQTADTGFTTMLLGLFAVLGMVLAAIGIYGTIAYLVAQRTQEFGVRIAVGAGTRDILWLVLRYGLSIGIAGVVFGLAGALLVRRLLTPLLFGVAASDPLTIGAAVLLLLVIVTASAAPARRAMRIDPVQALRGE